MGWGWYSRGTFQFHELSQQSLLQALSEGSNTTKPHRRLREVPAASVGGSPAVQLRQTQRTHKVQVLRLKMVSNKSSKRGPYVYMRRDLRVSATEYHPLGIHLTLSMHLSIPRQVVELQYFKNGTSWPRLPGVCTQCLQALDLQQTWNQANAF